MAETAEKPVNTAQKVAQVTRKGATNAQVLAASLKAIEDAGNMTPKMQRNIDRFAAKLSRK